MTVRQRRRRTLASTADTEWQRERDSVIAVWGDDLAECVQFWRREPGVPPSLREDPLRWRDLMADDVGQHAIAADMRAERAKLLAKRRRWLAKAGIG